MARKLFTDATETDPNSRITVASYRVAWTLIQRDEDAHVYFDEGVDFFDGDFSHNFDFRLTGGEGAGGTILMCWSLANLVDDWQGIKAASGDVISVSCGWGSGANQKRIILVEVDGGTEYAAAEGDYDVITDTTYYLTVYRKESVGTYGTLYLKIFSDSGRNTELHSQSIALHSSKKDYRYLYALQSVNTGAASFKHSGFIEDLDISGTLLSQLGVTTQIATEISGATATGNGSIYNTGLSDVTAHGHCWATTINPTTADSSVDNGAGVLGAFTSSITDLLEGQIYYNRAYATNSEGTVYGSNNKFIAGRGGTGSQLLSGDLGVKDEQIRYVGKSGTEYWLQGTPA